MPSRSAKTALYLFSVAIAWLTPVVPAYCQNKVDFAHDILPVLRKRCASCHSNGVYKGGLSLETREKLIDSGIAEAGSGRDSELMDRIISEDPSYRMPPQGERLTKTEIQGFSDWIDEGMAWPIELGLKEVKFKRTLALRAIKLPNSQSTHPIDRLLDSYFAANKVETQIELADSQFLRRAKLDLLGLLPTATELKGFSQRREPNKRDLLVDELISQNQSYASHWMSFWNDLLRNDYAGTGYIDGGRKQITNWLYKSLFENKPYDQFVKELVVPNDESDGFVKGIKWRGRVNASQVQPLQFSQNITQVFLGINMKCASCHDSFIDDWKLKDAYGMAAIISEQPLELHRCDVATGKMATSKFVFPSLGEIDQANPKEERLKQLSVLMTSKQNGRFSRTIVNRLWHRMMGRGLVHPVDVMADEAWSEDLLDLLASHLVNSGYDLKQTIRLIATSQVYRSASVSVAGSNLSEGFIFQGVIAKRMTAEQLVDSIWQVTNAGPNKIDANIDLFTIPANQEEHPNNYLQQKTNQPSSKPRLKATPRASLLFANPLLRSLGRPNREQVVTTRPTELSTLQALDLSNGKIIADWLRIGASHWLQLRMENQWTNDQLIEQIYVAALSRQPNKSEKATLKLDQDNLQESVEDLLWIVTMLPEFQFIQ